MASFAKSAFVDAASLAPKKARSTEHADARLPRVGPVTAHHTKTMAVGKYLVLGGTGGIGRTLANRLVRKYYKASRVGCLKGRETRHPDRIDSWTALADVCVHSSLLSSLKTHIYIKYIYDRYT